MNKLDPNKTTAVPEWPGQPQSVIDDVIVLPYNDLDKCTEIITKNADDLAAVIMEPVSSNFGYVPATPEFLQGIRDLTTKLGIVLIFDEVQTGMGRLGKLFGYELYGVEPDVITLAKGMGGGVPIGAFLTKDHCDVLRPGDHGSTYGGNALTCAGAFAVVEHVINTDLPSHVQSVGKQLANALLQLQYKLPSITEVRGMGLLLALEFKEDISAKLVSLCNEEGLLLNPVRPNAIRLMPPLNVSGDEIDEAVLRLESALNKM